MDQDEIEHLDPNWLTKPADKRDDARDGSYQESHADFYGRENFEWPPSKAAMKETMGECMIEQLSTRESEFLFFVSKYFPMPENTDIQFVDVAQKIATLQGKEKMHNPWMQHAYFTSSSHLCARMKYLGGIVTKGLHPIEYVQFLGMHVNEIEGDEKLDCHSDIRNAANNSSSVFLLAPFVAAVVPILGTVEDDFPGADPRRKSGASAS